MQVSDPGDSGTTKALSIIPLHNVEFVNVPAVGGEVVGKVLARYVVRDPFPDGRVRIRLDDLISADVTRDKHHSSPRQLF